MTSKTLHISYFLVLVIVLSLGAGMFFASSGNRSIQFLIGVLTAVSYMGWGFLYHAQKHDLHKKVVIEYMLISTIGIVLLYTVLGF